MITSVIAVVVSQLVGGMDMTTFVLVLSVVAVVVVAIVGVNWWWFRRHRFGLRDWAWSHGHAGQE